MQYVYILKCKDNSPYVGCTSNLKERFKRHIDGHVHSTKNNLPVELVFYCAFKEMRKAFQFEKYLKSGSGRAVMYKRFFDRIE